VVAGAGTGQLCQPFDSQERGVELAIEYICGRGKHGLHGCSFLKKLLFF